MCQIVDQVSTPATNDQPRQRDAKGRFAPGNTGGHGNPFGRRVAELRKAMLDAVSAMEIAAIIQVLVVKAMAGDVQAAKVVLSYTIGKPESMKDPDRVDVEEWALHKETLPMGKELLEVMNQPTPDIPLKMVNFTRAGIGFLQQKQIEGAYDKKEQKSEPTPSTNGHSAERAASLADTGATAETGNLAACPTSAPSTNGINGNYRATLPKGSFTDVPPGMAEFYDTLVKRGFAPPIPSDQKGS